MPDLPSLLPPNASSLERDIEQVSAARIADIPVLISTLWNADTCDVSLLGWLAWALSVDQWESDWSEAQKRSVLRESMAIHRVKGTVGAVRRALDALGFQIEISEWFEHGGEPGTFRVDAFADDIFGAGMAVDARLLASITKAIETVKPVRSHMAALRVGERFESRVYARAATRSRVRQSGELILKPAAHQVPATLFIRAATHVKRKWNMTHDVKVAA